MIGHESAPSYGPQVFCLILIAFSNHSGLVSETLRSSPNLGRCVHLASSWYDCLWLEALSRLVPRAKRNQLMAFRMNIDQLWCLVEDVILSVGRDKKIPRMMLIDTAKYIEIIIEVSSRHSCLYWILLWSFQRCAHKAEAFFDSRYSFERSVGLQAALRETSQIRVLQYRDGFCSGRVAQIELGRSWYCRRPNQLY